MCIYIWILGVCTFVAQGYGMYSEYCGLLFLVVNMFEMSSVIYANEHCEMTSSAVLPPMPSSLQLLWPREGTVGLLFQEQFPVRAPLGYLQDSVNLQNLSMLLEPGRGLQNQATGKIHTSFSSTYHASLNKWPGVLRVPPAAREGAAPEGMRHLFPRAKPPASHQFFST